MSFFRCFAKHADPRNLLDPEQQFSTPWGSPDHGSCDKCKGAGKVRYECRSCISSGPAANCPSCQGRVGFEGVCPACEGSGKITRTRRRGVAVFPTLGGLYLYLAERDIDLSDQVIVELEGRLSDDRDLDADTGALLIRATRIIEVRPADARLIGSIRERLGPI
jgi:hypothetical protein